MATTVASLLNEGIKKSGIMGKMGRGAMALPGVQAGASAAARGGRIAGRVGGKIPTGEATAIGGAGLGLAKGMMGMAGHVGEFLPKLGKLAGPTQLMGLPKKLLSKGMGMMGINLSLSTLLRQSQLFTGILGALFQILGGFVDVILMPFMPFFTSLIQKLAAQIPKIRALAQKVFDWLNVNVFPVIKKAFEWIWDKVGVAVDWISEHMPDIKEKIMGFFNNSVKALEPVLDRAKEIVGDVWSWGKQNVWPTLKAAFFTVLEMVKVLLAFIKDELWPVLKSIFNNLKTIIEGMLKWLREDIYPLIKDAWTWLIKEIGGFILWLADNIVNRLVTIIPMIQSIITQVLDVLLNSVLIPLWAALKPILMWLANLVMDNLSHIIRILDTKIMPFIKGIIDDLMPHIADLAAFFMTHLAPKIDEFFKAAWEFVDAFLAVLLPLIKWLLKHVVWPVAKFILKGLGLLLGVVFKIMTWVLKGLTWLLKLPFTWREKLLNPLLSALDFGFDWIKKIWHFAQTFQAQLGVVILTALAKFLQKMAGGGSIQLGNVFGKDIKLPMGWLQGIGNDIMGVANTAQRALWAKESRMQAGLSTTTGGMRAKYGTTPVEVTINNFSESKVLDDTRKLQIMSGEKREVENIQRREDSLGSYSDIPSGLRG